MVPAQIRYFLTLYEELNFTRAAKRCGVSQPSLTNGIKSLERQFGAKLFIRIRSSQSQTRPTGLARALKPHLHQIIDSARQAQKIAEQVIAKQNGSAQESAPTKTIRKAKGHTAGKILAEGVQCAEPIASDM